MANPRPAQTTCLSNCHPGIDQGTVTPNRSSPPGTVGKDEDDWFSPARDAWKWAGDSVGLYNTLDTDAKMFVVSAVVFGIEGDGVAPIAEVWDQSVTNMAKAHNEFAEKHDVASSPAGMLAEWFAGDDPMKLYLFDHYTDGKGGEVKLTLGQMNLMATDIDLFNTTADWSPNLADPIEQAKKGQPVPVKTIVAGRNDALGNFAVHVEGILWLAAGPPKGPTKGPHAHRDAAHTIPPLYFEGTMNWTDTWDFDPKVAARLKKPGSSNRPVTAEMAVDAVAALVDGVPFEVTSVTVPMTQYSGRYPVY
jgi:hypothetical protein